MPSGHRMSLDSIKDWIRQNQAKSRLIVASGIFLALLMLLLLDVLYSLIFLHELGHYIIAYAFGADPKIKCSSTHYDGTKLDWFQQLLVTSGGIGIILLVALLFLLVGLNLKTLSFRKTFFFFSLLLIGAAFFDLVPAPTEDSSLSCSEIEEEDQYTDGYKILRHIRSESAAESVADFWLMPYIRSSGAIIFWLFGSWHLSSPISVLLLGKESKSQAILEGEP